MTSFRHNPDAISHDHAAVKSISSAEEQWAMSDERPMTVHSICIASDGWVGANRAEQSTANSEQQSITWQTRVYDRVDGYDYEAVRVRCNEGLQRASLQRDRGGVYNTNTGWLGAKVGCGVKHPSISRGWYRSWVTSKRAITSVHWLRRARRSTSQGYGGTPQVGVWRFFVCHDAILSDFSEQRLGGESRAMGACEAVSCEAQQRRCSRPPQVLACLDRPGLPNILPIRFDASDRRLRTWA